MGPVSVNLALQETTRAAIDRTLAMGANVAAMRGMAVEANHQSLPLILVSRLLVSWYGVLAKDHHHPLLVK